MKNYTVFNYQFLFGDHMAKVSNQAKLYYVNLCFFAENGFVANPIQVLDSMGFDKSVYYELINNGELLYLPNRSEVFICSYYLHNKGEKPMNWLSSPFSIYWRGKLFIKKNGVATFNPLAETVDPLDKIKEPKETPKEDTQEQPTQPQGDELKSWEELMAEFEKDNNEEER